MIPIHELLSRIIWDKAFGEGDFEIGYYDRVEDKIIRLPFKKISFEDGTHHAFDFINDDGELHSVPLHRIKEVYKNGKLIWHRHY